MSADNLHIIEKYLSEEMTGEERQQFEQRMESDPSLKKEVEEFRFLIESLEDHGRLKELQNSLDTYYFPEKETRKKRNLLPVIKVLGMAASVAIVAMLSTLYAVDWFDFSPKKNNQAYTQLKKEVESISETQENIERNLEQIKNREKESGKVYRATGFPISENGYLLTNFHVIRGSSSIYIENRVDSLRRYKADLIYSDPKMDLAVLKVADTSFVSFGTIPYCFGHKEASLGEYVYTLGYPKKDVVFGEGSISSITGYERGFRTDTTAYQISIPVNPGNSGAPLINEQGEFIGIISGKNSLLEGTSFAIKSDYFTEVIEKLVSDTTLTEPLMPSCTRLDKKGRVEQIKALQPYIYMVKVYD